HRHDHHLSHHDEEQHHDRIADDRADVADLHEPAADMSAAHPVDEYDEQADEKEGETIQVGEQTVCLDGCLRVRGERRIQPGFLSLLIVESAHYTYTGDVFQQDLAHAVQQLLQL